VQGISASDRDLSSVLPVGQRLTLTGARESLEMEIAIVVVSETYPRSGDVSRRQ
jgi:hypothetical protein